MQKIFMKQNINFLLRKEKVQDSSILMILRFLLNTQMICKMFIKILNNLGKKRKVIILFDDMIADVINKKELTPVVTELFIRGRKLSI